jgi:hypothetical protein
MKYEVCAVHDSATQMFGRPFFVVATGQALRSFQDEVRTNTESDLHKHPSDFTLYHLGTFYDESGQFELQAAPVMLVRGKDVTETKE